VPEDNFFLRMVKEGKVEFTKEGTIIGFNEHAIFLPVRVMNRLYFTLKENVGEDKARDILRTLGKFQIEAALKRYVKTMGWKDVPKEKILQFGKGVIEMLGLGRFDFDETESKEGFSTSTKGTPFAIEFKMEYGLQKTPIDFYIAGIFESVFTAIWGKPANCEETKCVAKGDGICEFVVRPKK
jgi:hypothetical protein